MFLRYRFQHVTAKAVSLRSAIPPTSLAEMIYARHAAPSVVQDECHYSVIGLKAPRSWALFSLSCANKGASVH